MKNVPLSDFQRVDFRLLEKVIKSAFIKAAGTPYFCSEERWTLTFEAEKLDLRVKFGSFGVGSELSVEGEAGG